MISCRDGQLTPTNSGHTARQHRERLCQDDLQGADGLRARAGEASVAGEGRWQERGQVAGGGQVAGEGRWQGTSHVDMLPLPVRDPQRLQQAFS